jgi:phage terminase large subunit
MSNTVQIKLPPKLIPVFSGKYRYRGAYGGRGSGKSFSFAKMLAVRGYQKPIRILCARELQNSIRDSVHSGLVSAIESEPWLAANYEWGESYIRGKNGTEFIFKGLRHNAREIKSLDGIDICWVEEAESVSEASWSVLIPTIRKEGSEIWCTWNPEDSDSATSRRFIQNPPESCCIVKINYTDNPWFPAELEAERLHDLKYRPETYGHIWEGDCLEITDAQVFKGKYIIEAFDVDNTFGSPYHGMDFGFASDPTTAVQCYIKDHKLWIRRDCAKVGLELDHTAAYVKGCIPEVEKYAIRADSARPESISYLHRHGLPRIEGVKKWQGSVEDGIAYLKSFEKIVIHPDCELMVREARHYSYKIDKNTGDILPEIVDAYNHGWDAVRYAMAPMIKNSGRSGFLMMA